MVTKNIKKPVIKKKPVSRKKPLKKSSLTKPVVKKNVRKTTSKKTTLKKKTPITKTKTPMPKKEESITKTKEKPHPLKITNDPFVKGFLKKTGFYRYTHGPLYIVILTLIMMFFFEMFIYTKYSSAELVYLKATLFMPFMVVITLISLFAFMYLGYKGAQHNFLFNKMFSIVVNIVLLIAIVEIILTFIGFMTFLVPFVVASFESLATQKLYLFYLISWIFVKSVFYLFMTALSYLVFYKLRFVKY